MNYILLNIDHILLRDHILFERDVMIFDQQNLRLF